MLLHFSDPRGDPTLPIEYSAYDWQREQTFNHSGTESSGAKTNTQHAVAMNPAQQDELARLFAQNMQLSQQQQPTSIVEHSSRLAEYKNDIPIHFASAHYTHSAHVHAESQSEPSRSPPPPYHEAVMPEAMAATLRQHSIDPSHLLPHQIDLFLHADYEQRLRLLELWRISPPNYPVQLQQHREAQSQGTRASVEQEEREAKERYEHIMLDRTGNAGTGSMQSQTEIEPYIINGYEIAAASPRAVEPIYAATGLWAAPNYQIVSGYQQQQPQPQPQEQSKMEDQYGLYEQIRNHADWERLNEQMARETFLGMHEPVSMDDEMVM